MRKYALLLVIFLNNAFGYVYCPQSISCVYDVGCSIAEPYPYSDSAYFQLDAQNPNNKNYTEGLYTFKYAIITNPGNNIGCTYQNPSKIYPDFIYNLGISGKNVNPDTTAYSNKWNRITQYQYGCFGKASDCPFTPGTPSK